MSSFTENERFEVGNVVFHEDSEKTYIIDDIYWTCATVLVRSYDQDTCHIYGPTREINIENLCWFRLGDFVRDLQTGNIFEVVAFEFSTVALESVNSRVCLDMEVDLHVFTPDLFELVSDDEASEFAKLEPDVDKETEEKEAPFVNSRVEVGDLILHRFSRILYEIVELNYLNGDEAKVRCYDWDIGLASGPTRIVKLSNFFWFAVGDIIRRISTGEVYKIAGCHTEADVIIESIDGDTCFCEEMVSPEDIQENFELVEDFDSSDSCEPCNEDDNTPDLEPETAILKNVSSFLFEDGTLTVRFKGQK
jgi:hypothetical protein